MTTATPQTANKAPGRYMLYAVDANGGLLHCGPRIFGRVTKRKLRRDGGAWKRWAMETHLDVYEANLHATVAVIVHPVGRPKESVRYDLKQPKAGAR